MKKGTLACTYAKVLSSLCKDGKEMTLFLSGLEIVNKTLAGDVSLKKILTAPGVDAEEKRAVLDKLFKDAIDIQLLFFIKKLATRNLLGLLPEIFTRFRHVVGTKMDILHVRAITAVPIAEDAKQTLYDKLAASSKKTIELVDEVNPNILGGIRLIFSNNKMIDFSLKSQLERLQNVLQKKELQHAIEP